jgi:hypothetical protein
MFPMAGKTFLILGGLFILIGLVLTFAPSIPWLGRLPGDVHYQGKSLQVYFPITTCIILSILLTLFLSLFRH